MKQKVVQLSDVVPGEHINAVVYVSFYNSKPTIFYSKLSRRAFLLN
jgi:hypothetical protein